MALDPLTAILNLGNSILDRVLPDKAANDAAKAQLLASQLNGEVAQIIAQAQIDEVEAASQNIFVSGWRPAVGWACAVAFTYAYILQPAIKVVAVLAHNHFDPNLFPVANTSDMMPVLLGMLGLAGARTFEKVNGVGNGH